MTGVIRNVSIRRYARFTPGFSTTKYPDSHPDFDTSSTTISVARSEMTRTLNRARTPGSVSGMTSASDEGCAFSK
ncbi:TPA: hypothetical protein DCE37_11370 [Candidatus Latescibacteria bacterium]|nr:hypothetical protein [Candidatus Latescibacterota bacterium]